MNEVYVEWKNLIKVYMDCFDRNFFDFSRQICGNEEETIKGVMLYRKIDGKEELSRVYYQNKEVKKGELTIEILRDIQNKNRGDNDLTNLVNQFNLINE